MSGIVTIGWLTLDFMTYVSHLPGAGQFEVSEKLEATVGGRAASQAMALAAIEVPVSLVARVGTDHNGELLIDELGEVGVGTDGVTEAPSPSGLRFMNILPDGSRSGVTYTGANEYQTVDDINRGRDVFNGAPVVIANCEMPGSLILRSLEIAKEHGAKSIVVHTEGKQLSERLLAATEVIVIGAATSRGVLDPDLARNKTEHAAKALLQQGPKAVVVVTPDAVHIADDKEARHIPIADAFDHDEDGMDAFLAGMAQGLAGGEDLHTACTRGVRVSTLLIPE